MTVTVERTRGGKRETVSTHQDLAEARKALVRAEKVMRPLGYSLRISATS